MASLRNLTEDSLQQLERALSPSVTPPPPEPRFTPVDMELRNVSNLMFSLGRYKKGRECIKQHGITKTSSLYGILCHGAEPSLEELKLLTSILQNKYDELRPKEQPEGRLRRLKQEVLNILLRLFQLGNQGHWVLAEEKDIQIQDYTSDPILEYDGSDSANPDWWEGKLARLVERLEQAENKSIPFTTAPADAIDELHDQLTRQRRLFQRPGSISVGNWVQNLAPPSKRSLDMDDPEDATIVQSSSPAKRRKLAESQRTVNKLSQPIATRSPHTSSEAQLIPKTQAPSRNAIRKKPKARNQARKSATGDLDSADKSTTMRTVREAQISRFGRVLRRPDRYGFPNLTVARKQG